MLQKLSLLSYILPIVIFILFCTRTKIKALWVIFFYTVTSFLFDAILLTTAWGIHYKFILWNSFDLIQFIFLSYFFYLIIGSRLVRILIIISFLIYLAFFFISSSNNQVQFNSLIGAIGSIIILILSIYYLIMAVKPTAEPINIFTPLFLIVLTILLFDTSTLFLYVVANKLTQNEINKYWSINHYTNIITDIMYSIAFLMVHFQKRNLTPENRTVDYTSPNDR